MNEPQEITVAAGALRLAARVWGAPDAPAVLALHGWLDNAASFDRLAPLLDGLRIVALDLPGHGLSEHRPPSVRYHFVDFVADVIDVADALELVDFSLLGHSLGAAIASFVAGVIPGRVRRVALIEGLGPRAGEPLESPPQLLRSIEEMRALAHKRAPSYPDLAAATRARQAAGDFSLESARALAVRGTVEHGGRLRWRADAKLRVSSPQYLSEAQVLEYLRAITAPTLLVRGMSGFLVRRPQMQTRYESMADLRIHDLPGGHHLHLDDPQPVAAAVQSFLTE